jgi:hypothetical protein
MLSHGSRRRRAASLVRLFLSLLPHDSASATPSSLQSSCVRLLLGIDEHCMLQAPAAGIASMQETLRAEKRQSGALARHAAAART